MEDHWLEKVGLPVVGVGVILQGEITTPIYPLENLVFAQFRSAKLTIQYVNL